MDKNMTLEKRIAAELYCYQGKMSVFVDDLQGHTVEVGDRKSTRLNSSHNNQSRMPSSA